MYLFRAVDLLFRYSGLRGLRLVDTYDTIIDYHSEIRL